MDIIERIGTSQKIDRAGKPHELASHLPARDVPLPDFLSGRLRGDPVRSVLVTLPVRMWPSGLVERVLRMNSVRS